MIMNATQILEFTLLDNDWQYRFVEKTEMRPLWQWWRGYIVLGEGDDYYQNRWVSKSLKRVVTLNERMWPISKVGKQIGFPEFFEKEKTSPNAIKQGFHRN